MDKINKILDLTDGGRDLIEECYPHIKNAQVGKMFSIRDEKQPSAHLIYINNVCLLKDFGMDKAMNGIQVYAMFNNISFSESLKVLSERYGLNEDDKSAMHHGPEFKYSQAGANYADGDKRLVHKSCFSKIELSFLGPKVTEEIARALGWNSVERIVICKNNQEISVCSTPSYPIFAREMHDAESGKLLGHKIYQPRAKDCQYKFTYHPKGMKPGEYVHGLWELKNEIEKNGGEKLDCVVMCSGERDALVVKSMGYCPIWFNSETAEIPNEIINTLKNYAWKIILIPDIDSTGKKQGKANVKKHPDVYVAWLPDELLGHCGDQGKPCKDLRDWASLHPNKEDFMTLLNTAKAYKFWYWEVAGNNKKCLKINQDNLLYFLSENGFHKYIDPETHEHLFVRVVDNVVEPVTTKDVRNFLVEWSQNKTEKIRNLILTNKCTDLKRLEDLPVIDLKFESATENSQVFFIGNKQYMVTPECIGEVCESSKIYVWKDKVSQHDIELLAPMFSWSKTDRTDAYGGAVYEISVNNTDSKFFQVSINSSRFHWRKEEEGAVLTQEEMDEDNQCLAAKLFFYGYILHRRREKGRDYAPISLDFCTPLDTNEANGGTSKTMFYDDVLPSMGYSVVKLDNNDDDNFPFDQVTSATDIMYVDECPKDFKFEKHNDTITNSIVVNGKNQRKFAIKYNDVPKLAFITNFTPKDFGGSAERRRLYVGYSDYYHFKTQTNGYTETRTVRDDFGMALFQDDYPPEDWTKDINFLMQCEQFYLSVKNECNTQLTPPMKRLMKRVSRGNYDEYVEGWADEYFNDPEHLNCKILRKGMWQNYLQSDFGKRFPIEEKKFVKQLKAWIDCQEGLEYNPIDVCNDVSSRRIKEKIGDKKYQYYIFVRGEYNG